MAPLRFCQNRVSRVQVLCIFWEGSASAISRIPSLNHFHEQTKWFHLHCRSLRGGGVLNWLICKSFRSFKRSIFKKRSGKCESATGAYKYNVVSAFNSVIFHGLMQSHWNACRTGIAVIVHYVFRFVVRNTQDV